MKTKLTQNHLIFGSSIGVKKIFAIICLFSFFVAPSVSLATQVSATLQGDRLFYSTPSSPLEIETPTGAFTQEVPIQLPAGRNGLQSQLFLSYNSQQYQDSIVGFGWNLTLPYIERINKKGVENLYTRNDFSSSQYGELVATNTPGEYRPRVDGGDFVKFTFTSNTWTAVDKRGVQYKYGTLADSQVFDSNATTHIAKWMLEEVRDTNDNYVKYTYIKNNNQVYPSSIVYMGHGTTDGIYVVTFANEVRPDPVFDYSYGFLVKTVQRIQQISVTSNSLPVRSYTLAYTPGNNGYRSMLSTITESYVNEDGSTKTLPPWSFTYTNQTVSFTPMGGNMAWEQSRFDRPAYVSSDLDGNGLADIIVSGQYPDLRIFNDRYISTGGGKMSGGVFLAGGSDIQEIWAYTGSAGYQSRDGGTRLVDLNGDMLPDVVKSDVCHVFCGPSGNQDTTVKHYYLNDGTGHWGSAIDDSTLPTILDEYPGASTPYVTQVIIGNLNGDIKQDFYPSLTQYGVSGQYGSISVPNFAQMVDLNNDGLDDFSAADTNRFIGMLNVGGTLGGVQPTGLSFEYPSTAVGADGIDKGIRVVDINNDGLPDIVRAYSFTYWPAGVAVGTPTPLETGDVNEIWLNTGSGWVKMLNAPQVPNIANPYTVSGMWSGSEYITEMFDRDGDGVADIGLNKTNAPRQDLLKKVTLPTGGTIEATLTPTTQQMTGAVLNHPSLPTMVWTLTQLVKNDGFGNIETTNYPYKDGRVWFDGVLGERKFAGFGTVTESSLNGVTTTYYHQANTTDSTHGEYLDSFAKIGKPYRVEKYDTAGNLYNKTIYKWDESTTPYGNTFLKLAQKLDFVYDGNVSHQDKAETYAYDNTTGNQTLKTEWGEVSGADDGSFVDTGSDLRNTTFTYATGLSVGVSGALSQETVTNQSGVKVKESKTSYDNLAFGTVGKGNATKQESWKTGTSYVNTTKTYDTYGNVIQATDPLGKITLYAYDAYHLFPATITNALGHATSYVYNYGIGKAKQITDANGYVSQVVYDGHGRVLQELQSDLTIPSTLVVKTLYTYTDTPLAVSTQKTNYLDGVTTSSSYQYTDGFGRTIQTRTQTENTGVYAVKDVVYNNRGLAEKESLPYFSTGTVRTSPTVDATLYATYAYDALGRITSTTNVVGVTTSTYDNWGLVTTDPNGNRKDSLRDAFGSLVSVVEYNGGVGQTTNYTYDLLGNLTKVTDALGNVRNFTYDGLGRRLTAEDLHSPSDTTFGALSYSYDDAGKLIQKIDANSQVVNYTYDDINRPLTENYLGQIGTEVSYTYDTCTNGIGHVCSIAMLSGTNTDYTYNKAGNIASETKTIGGTAYTTLYTYDREGNQLTVTQPDGAQTRNTYNTAGVLEKIERKESGGVFADVVSNIDYSPMRQITVQADANNVTTTNMYDATKLYRLTRKLTQNGASMKVQDLSYLYDNIGNILQITDESNSGAFKKLNYTYDSLNRLVNAKTIDIITGTSTSSFAVEALVVGGGGGGGGDSQGSQSYWGAGGGGGQVQSIASVTVSTTPYTVIVGNGGMGGVGSAVAGSGTNSSFNGIIAAGGAGAFAMSSGISGNGNIGGGNASYAAGGGGGSSATGSNGSFSGSNAVGGAGGLGVSNSISGSVVSYGGGGGGAAASSGGVGNSSGGSGGAGFYSVGGAGTSNRGGGGGGSGNANGGSTTGGVGGSGVVIISYPTGSMTATGGTVTTSGSNTINTFTSNGIFTVSPPQATTTISTNIAFAYDAIGNLTTKTETTNSGAVVMHTYTYAGNSSVNYANPHAVTSIDVSTSTSAVVTSTSTLAFSVVKALVVGGGGNGGGGTGYGGGGGAGGYQYNPAFVVAGQAYPITVGAAQQNSSFSTITANAGGTGGAGYNGGSGAGLNGGSGGGGGSQGGYGGTGNQGNKGGNYYSSNAGAGGGGAGATATNGSNNNGTDGGVGIQNDITGSLVYYAGGGGGGSGNTQGQGGLGGGGAGGHYNAAGISGTPNTGGGGGGSGTFGPGTGGSGVVIIAYHTDGSDGVSIASTGGTVTTSGVYTIHSFTNSGTFTVATSTHYVVATSTATTTTPAVTSLFTYDRNGNLLSQTGSHPASYTWDYNNRITGSTAGSISDTYAYDHTGARVSLQNGTTKTTYVTKFYNLLSGLGTSTIATSTTAYTFLGDTSVATTEKVGTTTPVTRYTHVDYLGSTNSITDTTGTTVQTLEYNPYGSVKNTTGTYSPQRQYIGQYYDTDTSLNYLNARYYDSERGQFVSEDPVFWEIGLTQDGKTILLNPQLANSYSYAGDNPVNGKDPEGRIIETGFDVAMLAMSLNAYNNDPSPSNTFGVFLDGASAIIPGVPAVGGLMLGGGGKAVDFLSKGEKNTHVYEGVRNGESVYTGISKDPEKRAAQHGSRFDSLKVITQERVTRGQARGIEQANKEANPKFENKINSISPSRDVYQKATDFGKKFLDGKKQ